MLCHMETEHAENVIRRVVWALDQNHEKRCKALQLDTLEAATLYLYPENASMG